MCIRDRDIVAHIGGCQCLPTFLNKNHLSDTFQLSHLADESFHDDDGDNRKQHLVVTDIVQLEDNEAFAKQIKLSVGIQQEVILATLVIRFQHIQEPPHVKILLPCTLGLQDFLKFVSDELIEGIEGRNYGTVRAYLLQKEIDRVGECHLLGTCRRLVVTFPQGKDKRCLLYTSIYHYQVLQRMMDICEKYNLDYEVEEIFAAQNRNKTQPGVSILPQVEQTLGEKAVEAHILRRIFATIRIKDWETDELTTTRVVAYHQDGIQAAIGPCVKVCDNQCVLSP